MSSSASGAAQGDLYVWGGGPLGLGKGAKTGARVDPEKHPFLKGGDIASISFGEAVGAAALKDGTLLTWGKNEKSFMSQSPQLGRAGESEAPEPTPVKALQGIPIRKVAVGKSHCAAVSEEGDLYTWGNGGSWIQFVQGGLGHGSTGSEEEPALVELLEQVCEESGAKVVDVGAGDNFTVALLSNGDIYSWGEGESGRLGTGILSRSTPGRVEFPEAGVKAVQIATGRNFCMVLDDQGRLHGWGANGAGQLGLGGDASAEVHAAEAVPERIPMPPPDAWMGEEGTEPETTIVKVAAGQRQVLALTEDGRVLSWGQARTLEPAEEHFFTDLANEGEKPVDISCGAGGNSVLTDQGRLFVFGYGKSATAGVLGGGTTRVAGRATPSEVEGLVATGHTVERMWLDQASACAVLGPKRKEEKEEQDA